MFATLGIALSARSSPGAAEAPGAHIPQVRSGYLHMEAGGCAPSMSKPTNGQHQGVTSPPCSHGASTPDFSILLLESRGYGERSVLRLENDLARWPVPTPLFAPT